MFSWESLEAPVPTDRPLRPMRARVDWMFTFTAASYDLARLRGMAAAPT